MSDKPTPPSLNADQCYRRLLKMVVAALCKQAGFDIADQIVLETLTEMLASYLVECGRSSRIMADLAGRTQILPIDVSLALIEMGFSLQNFNISALRDTGGRIIVPGPRPTPSPSETKVIHVGKIRPHPPHIPDFMPPFPDPHTYVRTQPQIEYQSDYESARESAAVQQRNMEMSLVKFMLKIEPNIQLHATETQLAVLKPQLESKPYLSALLPPDDEIKDSGMDLSAMNESAAVSDSSLLDNPFLRPVKMPRAGQEASL